jgi:TolA-binding protein
MAKINKQGPKGEANKKDTGTGQRDAMVTPSRPVSAVKGNKMAGRSNRPRVGGTALPGAKATQPKQVGATNNPQQQQYESMNRDMRRRMEHLGTAPDQNKNSAVEQRRKKLEKRRRRIEERRQEVKKVAATGPRNISLGRRNTYFLIAVAVVIVIVIVLAVLVNLHIL